ncbi:hypothetical protein HUE87_03970 [Candidatus Sulfurimonas marisnigri]|uniref:Uncharacterized protein n=1 Tax=Candidatus Sulfurimonas marisnigri TaxID=2740405 RepID=A0A7S7M1M1_9BACT|nr:hypothetical protein [Candidatus Sulfurimonas marisnigri]QOY55402.1 hypothetical protein HUE87_03970 [Candidatus Sulfurimonas marisnigri]
MINKGTSVSDGIMYTLDISNVKDELLKLEKFVNFKLFEEKLTNTKIDDFL